MLAGGSCIVAIHLPFMLKRLKSYEHRSTAAFVK